MANTTNLNLVKPGLDDAALITQINSNMDLIDSYAGDTTGAMKKMCPVITGNTNNSGYTISSGEFFVANKKLYKATASIATNASWSSSATELSDHGAVNAAYSALNSKIPDINAVSKYLTANSSCTIDITSQAMLFSDRGNIVIMSSRGVYTNGQSSIITVTQDQSVNSRFTFTTSQNISFTIIARDLPTIT